MTFEEKQKLAKKLKIAFTKDTSEIELDLFIKEAEAKLAEEENKKKSEEEQAKIEAENKKKAEDHAKKNKVILRDTHGKEVDQKDYFYPDLKNGITDTAPVYFNKICGMPVDREELLEVFHNAFGKDKGFLFYKSAVQELYLIIVPLKYATTISGSNDSQPGDFQRHALSFINEGSVNPDSLKLKLAKVANHPSISKEPLA